MRVVRFIVSLVFPAGVAFAESDEFDFFEERIRPVLVKHCYECHSIEEGKSKGGLRVDSKRALEQGGDNGPAVVSGDLEESLLVTAIRYHDEEFEMPPDGRLSETVIGDFEKWIAMGAPDPRVEDDPVAIEEAEIDIEAGRSFWAYTMPRRVVPPMGESSEWALSEIDHFVFAALQENGLSPALGARPETLVRRLYFILCGLPPSPDDVVKWTRALGPDIDQEVAAQLVDTLLASPRFGEKWGQHWLDVARYADSTGGDSNNIFPEAWRYRDYVIDAFNGDKPYDRFIREQIAGDLLPGRSESERARNLVATGFLAIGQKLVGEVDERKFRADLVDEQIDATTRAFLGTTAACARCHDHKSDPIPQRDYYSLAAIFQNTKTHYGLLDAQARQSSTLIEMTGNGLPAGREPLSQEEYSQLVAERDGTLEAMDEIRGQIRGKDSDVSRAKLRRSRTQRDRAEAALGAYDEDGNPKVFVMGVREADEFVETNMLVRGEIDEPGPVVEPGFLQVVGRSMPGEIRGSGRIELANWIADPVNPLTTRVMANRIWYWLFGQGIVPTVDNFGASGDLPSHPALLDYLAIRLIENEWSMKRLIREVVLTRTWQQSSSFDEDNFEIDPGNRFFWRANPRRLDAESIRDAMLTVAGNLEPGKPTTPILDSIGQGTVGQNVFEPEIRAIEFRLRSVFLPRVRNVLPEALALYDAPDSSGVTGARNTTVVPLQALYSLNAPFVEEQARSLALLSGRMLPAEQIDFLYLKVFSRFPTESEKQTARAYLDRFRALDREESGNSLASYCHALLCTAEFRIID